VTPGAFYKSSTINLEHSMYNTENEIQLSVRPLLPSDQGHTYLGAASEDDQFPWLVEYDAWSHEVMQLADDDDLSSDEGVPLADEDDCLSEADDVIPHRFDHHHQFRFRVLNNGTIKKRASSDRRAKAKSSSQSRDELSNTWYLPRDGRFWSRFEQSDSWQAIEEHLSLVQERNCKMKPSYRAIMRGYYFVLDVDGHTELVVYEQTTSDEKPNRGYK
jgi:hypothetical protein